MMRPAEPVTVSPHKAMFPTSPSPCGLTASPPANTHAVALSGHPLAGRIAAPSFVIPAGVAENARFLAGRVDEVGLCLFESDACLHYGPADLPPDMAALPLRWHVHLPVDLPWPDATGTHQADPARRAAHTAAAVTARLMTLVPGLTPRAAVLHPPEAPPARQRHQLADFVRHWRDGAGTGEFSPALRKTPLLLENVAHSDVACLGEDFLRDHQLGLCLDVGHLLGYAQEKLLHSALPAQACLLHWSAPGKGDQHLPLTALTPAQKRIAWRIMADAPRTATHLVEVFQWEGLASSLPVLAALADGKTPDAFGG